METIWKNFSIESKELLKVMEIKNTFKENKKFKKIYKTYKKL